MLKDVVVLTPPLLVCAAFLIAVAAFLRHEMGRSRARRDAHVSDDISGNDTIPDSAGSRSSGRPDDADGSRPD